MSIAWNSLIGELRDRVPDCARSLFVQYLQDTLDDLCIEFNLNRDEEYIPLVESTSRYALDANIIKVWRAELQYPSGIPAKLTQKSLREYDLRYSSDRLVTEGIPFEIYLDPTAAGAKQVGFYPVPNVTTIITSGATNADPIRVTTTTAHGLTDEDPVYIAGITGNTNANGQRYANAFDADEFDLYYDSDLTDTVAGNGVYAGPGVVAVAGIPFCRLYVTRSITVVDSSATIPESLNSLAAALRIGAWRQWFEVEGSPKEAQAWARRYLAAKASIRKRTSGVLADVTPVSRPYVQQRKIRK